jgi:phosphoglycolate phosphatase-like HAD superfamily hydrolase
MEYTPEVLRNFQPRHSFFIGLDSDGCVFDTMEIKQKECFCPNNIRYWRLQPVAKYAREATEFVSLYSRWRGSNRFPALVRVMDLLTERAEVRERGFAVPRLPKLREWIASGAPLSNASLQQWVERTGDPELRLVLEWSDAVNRAVAEIVFGIPPFPYVKESIAKLLPKADLLCVSQTPGAVVAREWAEHGILEAAALIAGQELGTKKEHLRLAAVGKYPADHILMVGDALGDLEAAQANGVLFYPINPGGEAESWRRFHDEVLELFWSGQYAGAYQAERIAEFRSLLPETPPWQR